MSRPVGSNLTAEPTATESGSEHEEEARPTHTAEIGTLKKLSVSGGTAWLGSSSGVYFANTVRRAFSAAFAENSNAASSVPASEDILTGEDAEGYSYNGPVNENGPSSTDQDFQRMLSSALGSPPADRKLAMTLVTSFFRSWHPLFPFLHGPRFLKDMDVIYANPRSRQTSPARTQQRTYSSAGPSHTLPRPSFPNVDTRKLITFQLIINIAALDRAGLSLPESSRIKSTSDVTRVAGSIALNHDIETIQALLAAELYLVATIALRQASTIAGIVLRMLYHSGLHRCPLRYATLTQHDCEIRKRVFWSAYALDRHLSLALGDPNTFQDSDIDVCLSGKELHRAVARDLIPPDQRGEEIKLHMPISTTSNPSLHPTTSRIAGTVVPPSDRSAPSSSTPAGAFPSGTSSNQGPNSGTTAIEDSNVNNGPSPGRKTAGAPASQPAAGSRSTGGGSGTEERPSREAALTAYVHYGKLTGRIIEIFHKSINFRFPKQDAIGYLNADVETWWNDLPGTLTGEDTGNTCTNNKTVEARDGAKVSETTSASTSNSQPDKGTRTPGPGPRPRQAPPPPPPVSGPTSTSTCTLIPSTTTSASASAPVSTFASTSASTPTSTTHHRQQRLLAPFFAILYQQLHLLLNRPRLSLDQSTAEFQHGLQVCIRASRHTLAALRQHRATGQSMFLPGLLSATWMAGLIIAFACQLGKYPKSRACADITATLAVLDTMNPRWYTVKNCQKVLALLLANIRSRRAGQNGLLTTAAATATATVTTPATGPNLASGHVDNDAKPHAHPYPHPHPHPRDHRRPRDHAHAHTHAHMHTHTGVVDGGGNGFDDAAAAAAAATTTTAAHGLEPGPTLGGTSSNQTPTSNLGRTETISRTKKRPRDSIDADTTASTAVTSTSNMDDLVEPSPKRNDSITVSEPSPADCSNLRTPVVSSPLLRTATNSGISFTNADITADSVNDTGNNDNNAFRPPSRSPWQLQHRDAFGDPVSFDASGWNSPSPSSTFQNGIDSNHTGIHTTSSFQNPFSHINMGGGGVEGGGDGGWTGVGSALYANPQDVAFAQSSHGMGPGATLPEWSSENNGDGMNDFNFSGGGGGSEVGLGIDDQMFWGNPDSNMLDVFGAISWENMTGPLGPASFGAGMSTGMGVNWDVGFTGGGGGGDTGGDPTRGNEGGAAFPRSGGDLSGVAGSNAGAQGPASYE